jgi:predicted transposase/invertase (TIGR01784 family)
MDRKLINILIDFAFKRVFAGNGEESKRILMDFLNSLLELKDDNRINEIIYLNPFNDRKTEKDKLSIMDIKVETENKERIDIEVQINDVDDYRKRSLFYWSKLYPETLKKGEPYYNLKKSIVISIVNFDLVKESKKYHSIFKIKEKDENYIFTDDLELHYIELCKFNTPTDLNELNDLEEWITFLKECGNNNSDEIIEELCSRKEEIKVATKIIRELSADELAYEEYLAREKYWHDELSKKAYAEYKLKLATEKAIADGIEQGIEQGIEKGIEKGIEQGIEKGIKQGEEKEKIKAKAEKLNIAKSLIGVLDENTIAEKFGLSIDEVNELKK